MMSTGAPPYSRPTQRDSTFKYIINGKTEEVLKHWRRLPLISQDCLDCMKQIFKWEKDRISMDELIKHPFVDLEGEIMAQTLDTEHAFDRIQGFLTQYHVKYALPSHLRQMEDDSKESEKVIAIKSEMADPGAKYKIAKFGEDCKEILKLGPHRLLNDLQYILQNIHIRRAVTAYNGLSMDKATINQAASTLLPIYKRPKDDADDVKESDNTNVKPKLDTNDDQIQKFAAVYKNLVNQLKGQPFIQSENSMILRRCFRNRKESEASNASLIAVYGKENDAVFNDAKHRMSMQIMDRIYCYFAYAHDLGFAFRDDEIEEIEAALKGGDDQKDDEKEETEIMDRGHHRALLKVKGMLQMKKAQIAKTKYGKQVHEVMAQRKIKFCSSSINFMVDEAKKGRHDPQSLSPKIAVVRFAGIKSKMQEYLAHIKVEWVHHVDTLALCFNVNCSVHMFYRMSYQTHHR